MEIKPFWIAKTTLPPTPVCVIVCRGRFPSTILLLFRDKKWVHVRLFDVHHLHWKGKKWFQPTNRSDQHRAEDCSAACATHVTWYAIIPFINWSTRQAVATTSNFGCYAKSHSDKSDLEMVVISYDSSKSKAEQVLLISSRGSVVRKIFWKDC